MENKFYLLLISLFLINFVNANIAEDYKNEFSIGNESCETLDSFVYDVADPWFLNSNRKYTTIPLIYTCCSGDECTSIIFDGNHKTFINDPYMTEIIDLNYIRYNLFNGNLSENYFEVKGLDFCNYFGFNDAKKETLNLASDVVEDGARLVGTQKSYQIANTIKGARQLGVIGKFDPAILIAGVGCGYDNKKLNLALEHLALLNAYLKNIRGGYSQEGYVKQLSDSASLSKTYLKEYVESPTAMARGLINWILNAIKFLFGVAQNPTGKQQMDKTEYQIAEETLKEISDYNFYFTNPDKDKIILKNNERIILKVSEFNESYTAFMQSYSQIAKIKPSYVQRVFTNLFYNPNYNLTEGLNCWEILQNHKDASESYYKVYRFNSAIDALQNLSAPMNCAEQDFTRENRIKRNFDRIWLYSLLIILLLIIVIKREFLIENIEKFKKKEAFS